MPYREAKKLTDEEHGPSLGVHSREVSTLYTAYRESKKMTEDHQGPTLGVSLREVTAL